MYFVRICVCLFVVCHSVIKRICGTHLQTLHYTPQTNKHISAQSTWQLLRSTIEGEVHEDQRGERRGDYVGLMRGCGRMAIVLYASQ
jgi:hypothetical protein